MSVTEFEFFLLDAVSEHTHHLSLFDSYHLGEALNRHVPYFTRQDLIETLGALFQQGDLWARVGRAKAFVPTLDEIEAGLADGLRIVYGLTAQGGARWESLCRFDWTRFVSWCSTSHSSELIAPTRELAEFLFYARQEDPAIRPPVRWDTIRPWEATYWKTLPAAHRVRYRIPRRREEETLARANALSHPPLWWNEWKQQELRRFVARPNANLPKPSFPPVPQWSFEQLQRRLWSPNWRRLFAAIRALGRLGDPRAVPVLTEQLRLHRWPAARYAAAMALADLRGPRAVEPLIHHLIRCEPGIVRALGRLGDTRAVKPLSALYGNPVLQDSWEFRRVRFEIEDALCRLGKPGLNRLALLLRHKDRGIRWQALCALGRSGQVEAAGHLRRELEQRVSASGWDRDGEAEHWVHLLCTALRQFDHRPTRTLVEDLATRHPRLAKWTYLPVTIHSRRPSPDEVRQNQEKLHQRLLDHLIPLVTGRGTPLADRCRALQTTLRESADPTRRRMAADLLAQLGDEQAVPALRAALDDPDRNVRASAVFALGFFPKRVSTKILRRVMREEGPVVRYCARRSFDRLRNQETSKH